MKVSGVFLGSRVQALLKGFASPRMLIVAMISNVVPWYEGFLAYFGPLCKLILLT